jgi:hypothetical protein
MQLDYINDLYKKENNFLIKTNIQSQYLISELNQLKHNFYFSKFYENDELNDHLMEMV